jgi:histidine phosphotransferase ChpT
MILVAAHTIPRGGIVAVEGDGPPEAMTFKISARGLNARIPHAVPALLAGFPDRGVVDAHAIQPFYTGLLGRAGGLAVSIEADGDAIVVAARATTAPASAVPAAADAAASQSA